MAVSEATDLVRYAQDPESGEQLVVGMKEFQLAQVLLEGRLELLSQEVPSQWGQVHLFDLCLWFRLYDTAWAMAQRGVEGCVLEDCHLQDLLWEISWRNDARSQDLNSCWRDPYFYSDDEHEDDRLCRCSNEATCCYCSFGFPKVDGMWMDDWDADLAIAAADAHQVAAISLLQELLKAVSCGAALLSAVSEEVKARLLDLAILTGNKDAASCLARVRKLRPLRRWRSQDLFGMDDNLIVLKNPDMLLAALSAGIDLTELWWKGCYGELPFREAVAVSGSGRWSDFAQLLPPSQPGTPPPANKFWSFQRDSGPLCAARLRDAVAAGVALKDFRCGVYNESLLDVAIWHGQSDCAVFCAAAGVEIRIARKSDLTGSSCFASEQERQDAAKAAAREATPINWRRQCEKGVAIFQLMKALMGGRPFPLALVDAVLLYSMEMPLIVDKLDLWDAVKGWHLSILSKPAPQAAPSCTQPVDAMSPRQGAAETTGDIQAQTQPSGSHESEAADAGGPKASEEEAPDELLRAIQESRAVAPPLFNRDGVRLYRLTRMANAEHVVQLLFDPEGPLKELHQRVVDFGCAVDPVGNPVKILFVPCTEEQIVELQQLSNEHGLELCREKHVLALEKDEPLLDAALRSFRRARGRAELRPVAWPQPAAAAEAEEEPMIVAELGFQTDSSVGYPTYEGGQM